MNQKTKLRRGILYFFLPVFAATFFLTLANDAWYSSSGGENRFKEKNYPSQWFWLQRTFPYDRADKDAYSHAVKQAKRMGLFKQDVQPEWEFLGPENIGGRVVDIEFNPKNPNVVYAAAATGGVFKSLDHGENWFPVFDDQPNLTVGDLAVDPVDPNIVYVGTGEANGGHNNFPGNGVYKSEDGGNTWSLIGLQNSASIGRILVDPSDHQRVLVAAVGSYFETGGERGVYISNDGGNTWQQSLFVSDSTGAVDLIMDPQNPQFLLAAMWERVRRPVYRSQTHLYGATSAVYRSQDGGLSWEKLGPANGFPDATQTRVGRIGLAMCASNSKIIYALFTDGSDITGLYKSEDGGNTWKDLGVTETLQNGSNGFSWYFGQVRVHPTDPNTVFVLDVALMRSIDGGNTWPIIYGYDGPSGLHVDHHALAFDPSDVNYVLDGNDGGINISEDGGETWRKVAILPVTQFYEIGLDPQHPQYAYGGTQDNGTLRTKNSQPDAWERIFGGDGFYVLIDPRNPDVIYAEYQWGQLYKSTDGGKTFYDILPEEIKNERHNWDTPVVMDPQNPDVLYYGTNHLWRSSNGGASWVKISPDLTRNLDDSRVGTITTIAVAEADAKVVYVGTDDGLIWKTTNLGTTWTNISEGLPFRWVTRVAVDPFDVQRVYVTFSGLKWQDPQPHIFKSEDGGVHWQDISSNLPDAPINAFAMDTEEPEILFVGTDVGAFVSFDDGTYWQALGAGMPIVVVNDIKIHPASHELFAGTHGRSMYKIDLDQLSGLPSENAGQEIPTRMVLYQNYPNPFNASTTIRYALTQRAEIDLAVYDAAGRKVAQLVHGQQEKGEHQIHYDAGTLPSGVYFVRLRVNGQDRSRAVKMILIK